MKALFYSKYSEDRVSCNLCPHNCLIPEGERGVCKIRVNRGGELYAETYQMYSAISFDPIEKKPLYHYFPGKEILSLGSVGCNMRCRWCQNCEISQTGIEGNRKLVQLTPERILELALQNEKNIGVAYTYNEPSVSPESIMEVAEGIQKGGMKNVMVTNGFVAKGAMAEYIKVIDAFNVDVKAFDDSNYRRYTGAAIQPVLDNIVKISEAKRHIELTYLVVPEVNDSLTYFSDFVRWVKKEIGTATVLHISRYFPSYKMKKESTPPEFLEKMAEIASENLSYVYVGNCFLGKYKDTVCPVCKTEVLYRRGYNVAVSGKNYDGKCPNCKERIYLAM